MIKFYLLSGTVRSGKTTSLQEWLKSVSGAAGILAPVVRGKRYVLDILSGRKRLLDADQSTARILSIGPHRFDKKTFLWARNVLFTAWEEKPPWLVIDEIGPLELSGQGLEPIIRTIVAQAYRQEHTRLILVVRKSLIRQVYTYFKLPEDQTKVIRMDDLPTLL